MTKPASVGHPQGRLVPFPAFLWDGTVVPGDQAQHQWGSFVRLSVQIMGSCLEQGCGQAAAR